LCLILKILSCDQAAYIYKAFAQIEFDFFLLVFCSLIETIIISRFKVVVGANLLM
jgi:hypothetical protein